MDGWTDDAARALGERGLLPQEVTTVLRLARDVAHGVERRMAPLAAYLVGVAVGRAAGGDAAGAGATRLDALDAAVTSIRPLIPASEGDRT